MKWKRLRGTDAIRARIAPGLSLEVWPTNLGRWWWFCDGLSVSGKSPTKDEAKRALLDEVNVALTLLANVVRT